MGSSISVWLVACIMFTVALVSGCEITPTGGGASQAVYPIGGTVLGLATGQSVVLSTGSLDGGVEDTEVYASGPFAFPTLRPSGTSYNVTVAAQPKGQACTITGGVGVVGSSAVTTIAVTCVSDSFKLSGTVSGLSAGKTLVLRNVGGDEVTVVDNSRFTFPKQYRTKTAYEVTVATPPDGQACTVTNGKGEIGTEDVSDVAVVCAAETFTLGGTVSGLLSGTTLELQSNTGDVAEVTANGPFAFATRVASGTHYRVKVWSQPLGQTCTVAGASGTMTANVTSVAVTCAQNTRAVGGIVSGLAPGKSLVLRNGGKDDLTVTTDGPFRFATKVAEGASYEVTVASQPSWQTCSVSNAKGVVGTDSVSDVGVTCATESFRLGGTVSGLGAGKTLELTTSGGDVVAISSNGPFSFPQRIADGSPYRVRVWTAPVGQTCSVAGDSGTVSGADVTSIAVTCATTTRRVGGVVSGLASGESVTLQNNGGDDVTVNANGPFSFASAVAEGATYHVTVKTSPVGRTCTVSSGDGLVGGSDITSISVLCASASYTLGGTLTGLGTGKSVVLVVNTGAVVSLSADGPFVFPGTVADGASYVVSVLTQPAGQTCTLQGSAGTVAGANVTSVAATCSNKTYAVGGSLSGLGAGKTLILKNNGADLLTLTQDGPFSFPTKLASGAAYAVTVDTHPQGQTCALVLATGMIATSDVATVGVTCTNTTGGGGGTTTYTVGGTVSGLGNGKGVGLASAGYILPVSANGAFTFPVGLANGVTYAVTVWSHPQGQNCVVNNHTGTIAGANVTNVAVVCSDVYYPVGGTVSGLGNGKSVVLRNNGGNDLTVSANGSFTFSSELLYGANYSVTVHTQPVGQTCTPSAATGTIVGFAVTNVVITCVNNFYTVGGTLSGLAAGKTVTIQNNSGNGYTLSANGAFTFPGTLETGSGYSVTVQTHPTLSTCTLANDVGTVTGSNITNVTLTCQGWGNPLLVESQSSHGVSRHALGMSPGGGAVSLWFAAEGMGGTGTLRASVYTSTSAWTSEVSLASTSGWSDVYDLSAAADASGNAFAVWSQFDGSNYSLYFASYTSSAEAWSAPVLLEGDSGSVGNNHVAFDSAGNAMVVWRQTDGTRYNVWARHYSTAFGWGVAQMLSGGVQGTMSPRVAFDGSGNAFAVWTESDGTRNTVRARRYISGVWDSASTLETNTQNDSYGPKLAVNASGQAIVVWYRSENGWMDSYAYAARFENGAWVAEVRIDDGVNEAYAADVAIDAAGNAMAVWAQVDIRARRYTPGGGWGATVNLDSQTGNATSPAVALNPTTGSGHAVWTQDDGTRYNLWTAAFSPVTWGSPSLLETDNAGGAYSPLIAVDGQGRHLCTWYQSDGTRDNLWSARYQ